MKLALTREEVQDILKDHFKSDGEVAEVRLTPYGDYLAEVVLAPKPKAPEPTEVPKDIYFKQRANGGYLEDNGEVDYPQS